MAETLQEILTRFEGKIANSGGQDRAGESGRAHLLPDRHPVGDFFIADVLDWALKDDGIRWNTQRSHYGVTAAARDALHLATFVLERRLRVSN